MNAEFKFRVSGFGFRVRRLLHTSHLTLCDGLRSEREAVGGQEARRGHGHVWRGSECGSPSPRPSPPGRGGASSSACARGTRSQETGPRRNGGRVPAAVRQAFSGDPLSPGERDRVRANVPLASRHWNAECQFRVPSSGFRVSSWGVTLHFAPPRPRPAREWTGLALTPALSPRERGCVIQRVCQGTRSKAKVPWLLARR